MLPFLWHGLRSDLLGGALTTLGYVTLPVAALVQATDGNFYGVGSGGGANCLSGFNSGCGAVFRLTPDGRLGTLYSFCSMLDCADGEGPLGGLVQATDGTFYGTTELGGTNTVGTVFSLATGLGPFVTTLPTSPRDRPARGYPRQQSYPGATSVTFNSAPGHVPRRIRVQKSPPTCRSHQHTGPVQVVAAQRRTDQQHCLFRVNPVITRPALFAAAGRRFGTGGEALVVRSCNYGRRIVNLLCPSPPLCGFPEGRGGCLVYAEFLPSSLQGG